MNSHRQEGALCGYWHRRADERLGNSPKVTWSLSWSRRGWNTPVEFGVSKSVECDTFCLQSSDAVGWAIGRASGLFKVGCSYVGGKYFTGCLL